MSTDATSTSLAPFTLGLPVRFTHTDPAGYVFFPRYFEMFQAVVEEWFNQSLELNYAELIMGKRHGLPTAHTECDFKKPCRLGEPLEITLYLERIGRSSMRVRYVGRVNGEHRMKALSDLVIVNLEDGRPVKIDDDLRARLEAYQAACGDYEDN
jgi:4-hydroxybenzoyl-CoA thioesterase